MTKKYYSELQINIINIKYLDIITESDPKAEEGLIPNDENDTNVG